MAECHNDPKELDVSVCFSIPPPPSITALVLSGAAVQLREASAASR